MIIDNELIFDQVCAIIQRNRGKIKKPLTSATTLQGDLGIDGVDAEEIVTEYFSAFDVENSLFIFEDYFGSEGSNPFLTLVYIFKKSKWKEISVGHMVQCALNRQWLLP